MDDRCVKVTGKETETTRSDGCWRLCQRTEGRASGIACFPLPASTAPSNSVVIQTRPCREMQRERQRCREEERCRERKRKKERGRRGRSMPFKGTGYHLPCMYVCVVHSARSPRAGPGVPGCLQTHFHLVPQSVSFKESHTRWQKSWLF